MRIIGCFIASHASPLNHISVPLPLDSSGNKATLDTALTPSLSRPAEGIASLISLAADCLRHPDGHLYYIGASMFGILGYSTIVVAMETVSHTPYVCINFSLL